MEYHSSRDEMLWCEWLYRLVPSAGRKHCSRPMLYGKLPRLWTELYWITVENGMLWESYELVWWQQACPRFDWDVHPHNADSWHGLLHDTIPADSQDWQKIWCLKPLKHYHINLSVSSWNEHEEWLQGASRLALLRESVPLTDPFCCYLSSYHNLFDSFFFFFCFTFAIYLPKRGETPQTNGFSTRNRRSALRMFLNLRKCFALLIHAICAKILCVWLQGRILQSLPLGFQPLCPIYWKTRKNHSNWESWELELLCFAASCTLRCILFYYDKDDDYYYDGYSLEFSCLTYNFLLFLVLHIYCTLIWELLCDLQRTCFSKLTIGAGKDITFLKSMGRHHLPLSGPWCPYCNKGISFKISDSFLRWNAKPSHWARRWASYFCEAKFQCLYSPKAVPGCFMSCYFESQK